MKDPQLLPPKDYCPRFSPMSLLDGTKYCYGCNKPSDETEERTQSQLSCDSCGKVFFDKEHTNTNSSSRVIPGRPTFYGPNSMDPLHAFETANQATDPRRIIEENGPSLVADGEIGNDSSGRTHMNLSRPCAQLSSSNYLYVDPSTPSRFIRVAPSNHICATTLIMILSSFTMTTSLIILRPAIFSVSLASTRRPVPRPSPSSTLPTLLRSVRILRLILTAWLTWVALT
jgi:hypothetical protein